MTSLFLGHVRNVSLSSTVPGHCVFSRCRSSHRPAVGRGIRDCAQRRLAGDYPPHPHVQFGRQDHPREGHPREFPDTGSPRQQVAGERIWPSDGSMSRERMAAYRPLSKDLPRELIDACLDAADGYALSGKVAYERPATLECNIGGMRLLANAGSGSRLSLPFRFTKGTKTRPGKVVLGDLEPSRASGFRTLPDLSVTVAFRVKLSLYGEVAGLWLWRQIL